MPKAKEKVDWDEIIQQCEDNHTIPMPYAFIRNLTHIQAITLAMIVYRAIKNPKEEWIAYSIEEMEGDLNFSPGKQATVLKELVDLKLIERKRIGFSGNRYLRINVDSINKLK